MYSRLLKPSEVRDYSNAIESVSSMLEDVLANQAGIARRQSEIFRLLNGISTQLQEGSAEGYPRSTINDVRNSESQAARGTCGTQNVKKHRNEQHFSSGHGSSRQVDRREELPRLLDKDRESTAYEALLADLYLQTLARNTAQPALHPEGESLEEGEINQGTGECMSRQPSNRLHGSNVFTNTAPPVFQQNRSTKRSASEVTHDNASVSSPKRTAHRDAREASQHAPAQGSSDSRYPRFPFPVRRIVELLETWVRDGEVLLPPVWRTPTSHEMSDPKYCHYHRFVNHPTHACNALRHIVQVKLDSEKQSLPAKN